MKALNEIPEAWRLALQRERDAQAFYEQMARSAGDASTRSLFEMLVEQERRHEAIIEAEYRRLFEPDLELARTELPITWYEWGEDAFQLAAALDVPVLLYITAPWCEPCHLMERTTLADPEVVQAVNEGFLPILVDSDKRPDIDGRYTRGGWPTTAFLNAEGEVLESHNFLTADQMLAALHRVKRRAEGREVPAVPTVAARPALASADAAAQAEGGSEPAQQPAALSPALIEEIAGHVVAAFDRDHGGLDGAPKFHHADVLEFALALAHRSGEPALNRLVADSLQAMARGGLHDRVGGGFFRYTAGADWSEPCTEKLAEDQGQLLSLYLRAYQATGQPDYLAVAQGILDYVEGNLWDRDRGTFCSSQQADLAYYALDAQERARRAAPYVDRTAYTGRNAVLASAYLIASAVLDSPRYADLAVRALEHVWAKGYREGLGMHRYFDTTPHVPGLLLDQVTMAHAWLDAFEHLGREVYLQRAETLMRFAQNALRDADGGYFDAVLAPEAVGRMRRRARPFSENVLAAEAHLRLHRLTGRAEYRALAQQTLEALAPVAAGLGFEAARYALAVERFLHKPLLVTVVGENEDPLRSDLLRAARRAYAPNRTVQAVDPVWEPGRLARLGYPAEPAPAAYVCLGTLCGRPTADPGELLAQAQAMVRHPEGVILEGRND